ncbi:MAG TPA: hypothetical protein VKR29_00585 [Candidatus Binataceae bacterium]|nr:hypothetical protein [Candidatus Binataceae bacterium]
MKRADPRRCGPLDQRRNSLAHLGRGLVGERDREDLARVGVALAEQVGDTICDRAGLAGAGPRENQNRAVGREHRGALLGI